MAMSGNIGWRVEMKKKGWVILYRGKSKKWERRRNKKHMSKLQPLPGEIGYYSSVRFISG